MPAQRVVAVGNSALDLQNSLCSVIGLSLDQPVTAETIPRVIKDHSPVVLIINGFEPSVDAEQEWQALGRLLKKIRVFATTVMFQSANPFHDPALQTGSASMAFKVSSYPGTVPSSSAWQVLLELRPCCKGRLTAGEFTLTDPCVQELVAVGILGTGSAAGPCIAHSAIQAELARFKGKA